MKKVPAQGLVYTSWVVNPSAFGTRKQNARRQDEGGILTTSKDILSEFPFAYIKSL
jgi:hypothetical protein